MRGKIERKPGKGLIFLVAMALLLLAAGSQAAIEGVTGQNFNFTAKSGVISTADGNSVLIWGFANGAGTVQYPGPTMIVTEGQTVNVTLTNELTDFNVPVSIVFPGQAVTATGGTMGMLTREAPPDGVTFVTYSFTPQQPGTYTYYSGTRPDLQVEMGLVGAIIVRPATQNLAECTQYTTSAYGDCRSAYDYEYLFLLSEMDLAIHELVEQGRMTEVDNTTYFPVYWFINGRNAPDTMAPSLAQGGTWLPTQPYNIMPMMNPGGKMLLRMIGAGRDPHPFHTHGNNFDLIARDGRVLESGPDPVNGLPDLAVSNFTQHVEPGATYDAIFTWTGAGMGWDIYGHEQDINVDPPEDFPGPGDIDHNKNSDFDSVLIEEGEDSADHGLPFPVVLPNNLELTFGAFYSGSPFLGGQGSLPPGEGGNNPDFGFAYMWHTHNEKEMTNNDIFPGGMMTMMIIVPEVN